MTPRLKRLRRYLRAIDGFLVTDLTNVRYMTGFTGSSGYLLVTREASYFVTDFRYREQAAQEVRGCEIIIEDRPHDESFGPLAARLKLRSIGFETTVTYSFYVALSSKGLRLKSYEDTVLKMRMTKDEEELKAIQTAVWRAEAALIDIRDGIRPGVRELTIARRLEQRLKEHGCRQLPFEIIVASGPNSSKPHAQPGTRKLAPGDLLIIDWGGECDGYFSDMTRTFLIGGEGGEHIAKKKTIYHLVERANRAGVSAARPGERASNMDAAARSVIEEGGYGEYFGHSLGHGVGLEVHEKPRISKRNKAAVRPGAVFTVEPGIYLPGIGGVRIEDMVAARDRGCDVMTSLPRHLEILG